MKITSNTRLNMVIGYPLLHSQSPLLHQTIYQELGIDSVLLAHAHRSLGILIQSIKTLSVELTAVTSPFKSQVIRYLDECSTTVADLKAANTIIQRNGKLYGHNTDIDGIAFALRYITVKNKNVLVLGAGGAASAMGYFLKNRQPAAIFWLNRSRDKAAILANKFGGKVIGYDALSKYEFDIIVNATTLGLSPNLHESSLPNYLFNAQQVVFDIVYNPVQTALLKKAKKENATVLSGLDMFIGQGLKQVELLSGKKPTIDLVDPLRKLLILNQ